jgi:lauroyl/myristoyl acyltransferase
MKNGVKAVAEYAAAVSLLKIFGWMPRPLAQRAAACASWMGFHLANRQRISGLKNLSMTMPQLNSAERESILRACFDNLGRLLCRVQPLSRIESIQHLRSRHL